MRCSSLSSLAAAAAVSICTALAASTAAAAQTPGQTGQVTGEIVSSDSYTLTVQTPGKPVGVLNALTTAANRVAAEDLPYVWGGGHAQAGIASVGEPGGNGYNGRSRGYDCSGSVAAVLSGGGLWPAGASVPNDAGVISYLLGVGLIASGAGTGARAVTLYDEPGVHIFMSIDGRFFGTSDGSGGGDPKGGPGWLDVGSDVTSPAFRRYHFLPRALNAKTTAGYTYGFEPGPQLGLLEYPVGTDVSVTYQTTASGMLVAEAVTPIGEITTSGTVQAIGPGGSSLTITTTSGTVASFSVPADSALANTLTSGQIAIGGIVSVGYVNSSTGSDLISLSLTSVPPVSTTTTPTPTTPTTTVPTQTTVTATTPTTTQPSAAPGP